MSSRALSSFLAAIVVAAGCGGPAPAPQPTPVTETSGAITDVVPPDLATGVVPKALDRMQDDTQALFSAVPSHEWSQVDEGVADLERSWKEWDGGSDAALVPDDLKDAVSLRLGDLKDAVGARKEAPILRAANNLEMAVLYLVAVYRPAMPTAVGRLDVTERDLMLDAAARDKLAASETLTEAAAIWQDLRIQIHDAGGEQVAADFDGCLDRQQKALEADDMAALEHEARAAGDVMVRMEALFG